MTLKRFVLYAALVAIVALVFLSIYGASVGSEKAKAFFNSVPLTIYWHGFLAALLIGIAVFTRLLRVPSLLLIHLGCVLVLAGAMWGSNAGHQVRRRFFATAKIPQGAMKIYEGQALSSVVAEHATAEHQLPFRIRLKDFRIEYYRPQYLQVEDRHGQIWQIPVQINKEFLLAPDLGTVTVLRKFENLKILFEQGNPVAVDEPQQGSNAALQVQFRYADGTIETKYAFERFLGHVHRDDRFRLSYRRSVREYISELEVTKNGSVVARKSIEVNHPLHYGGYHFYQDSYGADQGWYTVLQIVSDSGLYAVYAGYAMLCAGMFWHFWFRRVSPTRIVMKSD